jgi:hypothetical protein
VIEEVAMPYTAEKPSRARSADELRAAIPGWGADLDPRDRPSVPKERMDLETGAHWTLPEQQAGGEGRERSIEHSRLTPVFGTVAPLKGLSGVIRRFAYARFSEGRAAHWLLLVLGDRVDAIESHLASFVTARPDNPFTETGIAAELHRGGIRSRRGRGRVDTRHAWIDPILIAGPWVLTAGILVGVLARRRRR